MNNLDSLALDAAENPPLEITETLLANLGDITMLPAVASEAIELANDQDCTALQLGQVVQQDISLATEILTIANSAMFSGGRSIVSLEQAIVRLGFNQCRALIVSSSTACLMKQMPLEEEWVRQVLWQHSFVSATACTLLNRTLDLGFRGEEFSAGLLHDFGRLLLAVAAKRKFSLADPLDFRENERVLEQETLILGTNHCQLGAWFATHSGLPACLVDAIRWHHDENPPTPNKLLVALAAAGDHIANHLQRQEPIEDYDSEANRGLEQISRITETNILDKFAAVESTLLTEIQESSLQASLI